MLYLMFEKLYNFLKPSCREWLCDWAVFHTLDGLPFSIFVPECGCPVHDAED